MSVRVASPDDGESVAAIYAPYVLKTAISFEEEPPSGVEMASRIAATVPTHPFLVFEDAGRVLGYAYGGVHVARASYRWSANVSVYVVDDVHRRGIGRRLYESLLATLARPGFHSFFAGLTLPHQRRVGRA